jgi:hypothetical protein
MADINQEEWDLVIRPQRGLFDLRLGELWHARELITDKLRRLINNRMLWLSD